MYHDEVPLDNYNHNNDDSEDDGDDNKLFQSEKKDRNNANPFDDCIVLMDEFHNLTRPTPAMKQYHTQLDTLRKDIYHANNCDVYGFTATPFDDRKEQFQDVLNIIKGKDGINHSNEGYYVFFNKMPSSVYPQLLHNKTELGRVLKVPLQGQTLDTYIKKMNEKTNVIDEEEREAKLLPYCTISTFFGQTSKKSWQTKFLKDPVSLATKLAAVSQFLNNETTMKTLMLIHKQSGYNAMLLKLLDSNDMKSYSNQCVHTGYCLSSFREKTAEKNTELQVFNNDIDGKHMTNAIADSNTYSEGVSFLGVRTLIIIDVPTTITMYLQLIGRALRACGHSKLPSNKRNIEILFFVAEAKSLMTADEYFLRKLRRDLVEYRKLENEIYKGAINFH